MQKQHQHDSKSEYDFIVCGSGSSGSVIASRLAENPKVSVLLLEAGGTDVIPSVTEPAKWTSNMRSERDWCFQALANPHLEGRIVESGMGKVLGGGSSINALAWLQGRKEDWNSFAKETKDPRWSFQSLRALFGSIETWQGPRNGFTRGANGPVYVEAAENPSPIANAMLDAAREMGIPRVESLNGIALNGTIGAAFTDLIIKNGIRQSIFQSYVAPKLTQSNLTVLPNALVTRIHFSAKRAVAVEVLIDGTSRRISASTEIILSLGTMHTPKVLMQSGIGDVALLGKYSIAVVASLPGVGQNFQDHPCFDILWEYDEHPPPRNNGAEALAFWKTKPELSAPDILIALVETGRAPAELAQQFNPPASCWTLKTAVLQPKSRGQVTITGPDPDDPLHITTGFLQHPDDIATAVAGIQLGRQIGQCAPLARYRKREVMPGDGMDLERFARLSCVSFHHQSCTAKMGIDDMSVVDSELRVYGVKGLRVADASVFPNITRGNTMAPCVVVGEHASLLIKEAHGL